MKKRAGNLFFIVVLSLILLVSGCSNRYSYRDGLKDIEGVEAKYLQGDYVPSDSLNDYIPDMNLLKTMVASKGNSRDVQAVIALIEFKVNSASAKRELIGARAVSKDGITCDEKTDASSFYEHSMLAAQYTRNAADALGKLLTDYKSFLDGDTRTLYSQQKTNLDATSQSIEAGVVQMKDSLSECT